LVISGLLLPAMGVAQEVVRVGVYLNPPLSFPGENGKPSGFIVDLLDYIALKEEWGLEYVSCSWEECNELLSLGEIDMLSPIAINEARQRRLDFNRESLYVNWGQIVTAEDMELSSPLDLQGKTVIALSSDIHFADLKDLAQRFDIQVRFLEVDDYEAVLAWVAEGPADAGLINRSFAISDFPQYDLIKSSVIFNPAEIRIALSPRNDQLENALRIQRLDRHISRLKADQNSLYYQLRDRWFGRSLTDDLPKWVVWTFAIVLGIALLLAAGVLLLRQQVRRRTSELWGINERFTAFMNNLPGMAYMKAADGRYIFVNPTWEQTKHLASKEVVGRMPAEIWPTHGFGPHTLEEQRAIEHRVVVETVEINPWDDESRFWRLIRFPIENSSGDGGMVGGIGIDITAQKGAEQELSHLHRQLQLLLESAGDGIFGVDGVGRCTFINQVALELLGFHHEEIIGNNLHDLIQHSDATGGSFPEVGSSIYLAYREGRKSRVDNEVFWRADGASLAVEYSAYPIAEGEHPGAVVVFRAGSKSL